MTKKLKRKHKDHVQSTVWILETTIDEHLISNPLVLENEKTRKLADKVRANLSKISQIINK